MAALKVTDSRTGESYSVPISDPGTVNAADFRGLMLLDPGYTNTAACKSKITFIDGEKGILHYRGYPIEQLAEHSSFLEVSYLLIYGELPDSAQLAEWETQVLGHTFVHTGLNDMMSSFHYDSHPMSMFTSSVAALSAFHADANPSLVGSNVYSTDKSLRNKQIVRLLGKVPTLAAMAYRNRIGRSYNPPQNNLSYAANFLYMLDHLNEPNFVPNPRLARALDILFILHADHELNCSTATMRQVSSSLADPYSCVAASAAALSGPSHGGANEAVVRMLEEIGKVENVPAFLDGVKRRTRKLMGFGHRIYRNFDPRAKIIRTLAMEVFEITGREPLIDIALALEKAALEDEFFIKRKLYPNVDFYSGCIYRAMGFPLDMYPVLFAIPRTAGWLAHWKEQVEGGNVKIWRPRQVYVGQGLRQYVPIEQRSKSVKDEDTWFKKHEFSKRRTAATWKQKKAVAVAAKL
ncbi:hypothetical protein HDU84_003242 [Entophlyctis sp. JEL0112]|nr:hypothetical protein HDU84_003242 [Entophlyctis sp. JEL0112]